MPTLISTSRRLLLWPWLLLLLVADCLVAQDFVGSAACAGCHEAQHTAWQQSHHRRAMEAASPSSVLGNFDDATFDYFGTVSRFYRRDGAYYVETDNAEGALQEFRIAYTFGFYPLQQYLVEFPDGRLQTLSLSWDSRAAADGGQRWFHLYPDEKVAAGDPLHWTGAFQNWNSRCAACHSTDLAKGYDAAANRYKTTWAEMTVGCEACHGAAAQHVSWANGDRSSSDHGFKTSLTKAWEPHDGQLAIPAEPAADLSGQAQVCFSCHSLRSELQPRNIAGSYYDNFSPSPLQAGFYHADGQIEGEVYEFGSFLQSRMHQNQVSCTNCHDAHSGKLRSEGNGLCLQCHQPSYASETHVFHKADSAGAQCINCHMPTATFMGVDQRRDHSFRVPDPAASLAYGVPNACTQCHRDRDAQWAADVLAQRGAGKAPHYAHTAALAAARNGDAAAAPALLSLAQDTTLPTLIRATALLESGSFPSQQQLSAVLSGLADRDPLLRMHAVGALTRLDPTQRLSYLQDLIKDPAKAVRNAVARQLLVLPSAQWPASQRAALAVLFAEYRATLAHNADMPEAMSELGLFHLSQGNAADAEQAFLQARTLAPRYLPAMLNLADLYRARRRDDLAEPLLQEALLEYPESADVNYALGLLYVRTQRTPSAVPLLQQASERAPANAQYALVHGLALLEAGQRDAGLAVLEAAVRRFPDDPRLRSALEGYRAR